MNRFLIAVFTSTSSLLLSFSLPCSPDRENDETFSIAILPDTQFYTAEVKGGKKEQFFAQTEWIKKSRESENIQYVIHLGDIVNYGERDTAAWQYAAEAMYTLEEPQPGLPHGIPYGMAVGNHDQSPGQRALSGKTKLYNRYFGITHFSDKPWYGGHYRGDNDSHFDLFSAGGIDFRDSVHYGQQGDVPVPGDYDGDGFADVAVFRPSEGTWYINGLDPVKFGGPKSIPVPGDYDGDGMADPAIFVPGRNIIQVYMFGNQPFEGFAKQELIPVPADYDGDGRTDFVVYNPSTGEWIFEGMNRKILQLGKPGDIPIPGNYSGNGRAEPAVYRKGKIILQDREVAVEVDQPAARIVNSPLILQLGNYKNLL